MRNYSFGKTFLEIDKMAGLQISNRDDSIPLPVKWWDDKKTPKILWSLTWNNQEHIWQGILYTASLIDEIFIPELHPDIPKPYRMRSGSLWKTKTTWVIRLESNNWKIFQLTQCNWWEEKENMLIWNIELQNLYLQIKCNTSSLTTTLLDIEDIHLWKLNKINFSY